MSELSEREVRDVLNDVMAQKDAEYTWVTGEVTIVTRDGGEIRGDLRSADRYSVVVVTDAGEHQVCFGDVVNVMVQMRSPGPE